MPCTKLAAILYSNLNVGGPGDPVEVEVEVDTETGDQGVSSIEHKAEPRRSSSNHHHHRRRPIQARTRFVPSKDNPERDRLAFSSMRYNDYRFQRTYQILLLLVNVALYVAIPWFQYAVRRSRFKGLDADEYSERSARESKQLDDMFSFHDWGWGFWALAHHHLEVDENAYYFYMGLIYLVNFALMFWYIFRVLRDNKATLTASFMLLAVCGFAVNSLSMFPLPPGFIQPEPEVFSLIGGFVVQGGQGMISERVAFSFICFADMLDTCIENRSLKYLRWFLSFLYCVVVLGFLWATHQTYTGALAMNVMAAFMAYNMGQTLAKNWETHLQELADPSSVEDARHNRNPLDFDARKRGNSCSLELGLNGGDSTNYSAEPEHDESTGDSDEFEREADEMLNSDEVDELENGINAAVEESRRRQKERKKKRQRNGHRSANASEAKDQTDTQRLIAAVEKTVPAE